MASLGATRRRHSKQSSSSSSSQRKAPPSVISTVSSASSNATLTPKAVFPPNLRPSKRPDVKKEPVQQVHQHHDQSSSTDNPNKENIDVFAFMEQEADKDDRDVIGEKEHEEDHSEEEKLSSSGSSSSSSSSARIMAQPQRSPRYSDLEVRPTQDGLPRTWGRGSLHSDSGISVRSSSPDQGSPIMQHKLPTVFDEPDVQHDPQESYPRGRYGFQLTPDPAADRNLAFRHTHWPLLETDHNQCPEAYYAPSPPMLAETAHDAGVELSEMSPRLPRRLVRDISHKERLRPKASMAGYEVLASNIHSNDDALLKPIYRKFEMLNNRMLLFLQDELSEMEEQLKDLDDAIALEGQSNSGGPASRRAEAKLPSRLQWHRLELLGRSFAKVEQYSEHLLPNHFPRPPRSIINSLLDRALTSYTNLTKSLGPASHADISAYRTWITEHSPIVETESAFLNKELDLISVSSDSAGRLDFRSGTALETPVVVVTFGLLSTIMVFKLVPQILARLVISAMVGVAILCTLSPKIMNKRGSVLNWRKAIAT